MDKTRTKPSFIKSAKEGYVNLKEEILDLHSQSSDQENSQIDLEQQFNVVKEQFNEIKESVTSINNDIVDEVTTARGVFPTLVDRLETMSGYELLKKFETLTTSKTYSYDDQDRITDVFVRGDVNFDILYYYDKDSNIRREERRDLDGNIIGYKDYTFDDIGQIITETGENTDDVLTATTSLITEELNQRLIKIEAIDFVKLAEAIGNVNADNLWNIIQELLSSVQHLEMYLPDNQGQLIEISSILNRLDSLENKIDENHVIYSFDTTTDNATYTIPNTVPSNASIYLEGLLLTSGSDYLMADGSITFLIPLIDDFTISCKY